MPLTLHAPRAVYSLRHAPSWLLLAFSAGAVNAGAFLATQRFVTHVTGTVSRLGMDFGQWTLMLDYAIVLGCFIVGAMTSVLALDGRHHRGKQPLHALPLLLVSATLAVVAVAGSLGAFGRFGGTVEQPLDFLFLSVLAFAMGLQNATVATTTGLAVRTTHMTGPATDLGINLATAFFAAGEARLQALRGAALRGGKIVSFVLGAVAMVPLAGRTQYLAFLLPSILVTVAALSSFAPSHASSELKVV